MVAAERRFKSSSLRADQNAEVQALHLTDPAKHEPALPEISEAFLQAMSRPCPFCTAIAEGVWHSPEAVAEKNVHFNDFQTALINTAGRALTKLTGVEAFAKNPAQTIAEVLRLFLATDPVQATGVRFDRPARIVRGKIDEAKAEHQRGMAVTVHDAPPEVLTGEIIEQTDGSVRGEDASEELYSEPEDASSLYNESEGGIYGDDDQSDDSE
jgi:hypothetical protein